MFPLEEAETAFKDFLASKNFIVESKNIYNRRQECLDVQESF